MDKNKKGECGICKIPYFERNNFFYGKLMTVRDFFAEQCYFNEKRWLINKATIGWGVVCGLEIKEINGETGKVKVSPGMALDCCGREILVCEEQIVDLVPEEDECEKDEKKQRLADTKRYLICIEYRECKTEPLPLPPISCDQKEQCEFNRIRDSFRIRVIPYHEPCGPEPFCPQDKEKKLHDYLCQRLLKDCPGCPGCPESNCVILAEVTVTCRSISNQESYPDQDKPEKSPGKLPVECRIEIDNCQRRKLVISNEVLYDLIHCYHGDLPHITKINWPHNDSMTWNDFREMIKLEGVGDFNEDGTGLIVEFDKDVEGVNEDTFIFLVKYSDPEAGYIHQWFIPGEVTYDNKTAVFKVDKTWLRDMLGFSFIHGGADFEVILRGDHIVEDKGGGKTGKALDANFIGGKLPSGNGIQGGDFVSWFSVEPEKMKEQTPRQRRQRQKK